MYGIACILKWPISNGTERPEPRKLGCSVICVLQQRCCPKAYGEREGECGKVTVEEGSISEHLPCSKPCARDLCASSYLGVKKPCKVDVEQGPNLPSEVTKEVTCQHQRIWWSSWVCWPQSPCTFPLSCLLGGLLGNG